MSGLPEFLLARFADDEAVAKAATRGPWSFDDTQYEDEIRSDANGWPIATSRQWRDGAWDFNFENPEDAVHAARWDPSRVLAECEAKRRIVEWCSERNRVFIGGLGDDPTDPANYVPGDYAHQDDTPVLRLLALPYADHPDYLEEWRA